MIPKLIFFDIDNTLTRSKQAVTPEMATTLESLCRVTKIALISGGTFEQLSVQVAEHLPATTVFENIYILSTSGGALYEYKNAAWVRVYEESLTEEQAQHVMSAITDGAAATGLIDFAAPSYGQRIEMRGSQVTLSALGQQAPIDLKTHWDVTGEKRNTLREAIAALLPDYDVKQGGSTSIDVTKQGINKAYGIRKLAEHLNLPLSDMLYVGDALQPGGNDAVALETGIAAHSVTGPDETQRFIIDLLKNAS